MTWIFALLFCPELGIYRLSSRMTGKERILFPEDIDAISKEMPNILRIAEICRQNPNQKVAIVTGIKVSGPAHI